MAIIGIDLGTTNSLVSTWKNGELLLIPNAFGEYLTPSAVGKDKDGTIYVGKIAKERKITHPSETATSFKQFMGTDKVFRLQNQNFYAEDLSSFILRQLKADAEVFLGEPIEEAVISVPAYFNDQQRSATKASGKLAGIRVDRIINEPSAAAIAYQKELDMDGVFLVFDFGGGTLDISIAELFENIVDILAVSGDNHLGGDTFNEAIQEAFYLEHPGLREKLSIQEQESLLKVAEQCKITLSTQDKAIMAINHDGKIYQMCFTYDKLLNISEPILFRIKEIFHHALKDSGRSIQEIDEIILVGGSSKMPLIQEYITHLTGKTPRTKINPDEVVSIGCGIVSGIKNRDEDIKDMVLTDICPFTLGVEVHADYDTPNFSPIIERNSSLPITRKNVYVPLYDNQRRVIFAIYQGESFNVSENLFLGKLSVKIPPKPKNEVLMWVQFSYDINGILMVTVEGDGFNPVSKLIVSNTQLDSKELDKRVKQLRTMVLLPREEEENKNALEKAARIYQESAGFTRDRLLIESTKFEKLLRSKAGPAEVAKARIDFLNFLDAVDIFSDGLNQDIF